MKNTLASLAPAGKAAAGTRLRGRIPIRWFSAGNSSSELKSSIRRSRWWICAAAGVLMLWPGESRGEIVAESASRRNGKFVENLGLYNPKPRGKDVETQVNLDRVDYWLSVGALPSDTAKTVIKKARLAKAKAE